MSRTEVAEWEEPRHPGPAVHEVLPHFTPLCNTIIVHRPTGLERRRDHRPESGRLRPLSRATKSSLGGRTAHYPLQKGGVHAALLRSGVRLTLGRSFCRRMWHEA